MNNQLGYKIVLSLIFLFSLNTNIMAMGSKSPSANGLTLDPGTNGRKIPNFYDFNGSYYLTSSKDLYRYAQNKFFYGASHSYTRNNRNLLGRVFNAVKNDPVAKFSMKNKYDPNRRVGFCFGRALAAQLHARSYGVDINDIKKIAVVGKLSAMDSGIARNWRYHIATVLRAADGKWYTIDPIFNRPLSIEEWVLTTKKRWDKSGQTKYYAHAAEVFVPSKLIKSRDLPHTYNLRFKLDSSNEILDVLTHKNSRMIGASLYASSIPISDFTSSIYKGFFVDMLNNFRKRDPLRSDYALSSDEIIIPERNADDEKIDWRGPIKIVKSALLGGSVR